MKILVRVPVWLFAMMCAISNEASAQDIDSCAAILYATGRNYTADSFEYSLAEYAYSNLCQGSSAKAGLDFAGGMSTVIEAVPVKFTGNLSGRREKVEHLCKTSEEWRNEKARSSSSSSTVVLPALQAFNDCRSLQDIQISFRSPTHRQFSIGLRRAARAATFEGLTLVGDGKVSCTAPGRSASGPARVPVTPDSRHELDDQLWTITCEREALETDRADHERVVPEVVVQVDTTERSLSIPLPAERYFGPATATELQSRLDSMQASFKRDLASLRQVKLSADVKTDRGGGGKETRTTMVADYCALSVETSSAWPKDSSNLCTISRAEQNPREWTLVAGAAGNGAARCQMVCLGTD